MTLSRKAKPDRVEAELGLRPLTARSVVLSTLLGLDPPTLPASRLVATAGLFGIGEGTTRVALSRMTAAGELTADDGVYRLGDRLLERQRRQASGRRPPRGRWRGGWHLAVVTAGRRAADERAALRDALLAGRMATWRDGVWLRPDNLERPELAPKLAAQCTWVAGAPDEDPPSLAAQLWDLAGWATTAHRLIEGLDATRGPLDRGDTDVLAAGFVRSAAVLRHLAADPLLPAALLPEPWPGDDLRAVYDGWDAAYRRVLASWHRSGATVPAR
jgi:phenylacetic acid degradation operon negative regulatory protein